MQIYCYWVFPFFCGVVNSICQIVCARAVRARGLLYSLVIGFVVGLIVLCVGDYFLLASLLCGQKETAAAYVISLIMYGSLSCCYFHFVNMTETARRIRILRELSKTASGLSFEEFCEKYNAEAMVRVRLDRLLQNGQIRESEGRYYTAGLMVLGMSWGIRILRILLGKSR